MYRKKHVIISLLLSFALASVAFAAETVIISFEQTEGFPPAGSDFSGKTLPGRKVAGAVASWTADRPAWVRWIIVEGAASPGHPPAVSGARFAALTGGGPGVGAYVGSMILKKDANLGLDSFHWAWRGSGDSRPGGDAWLEVEYYDLKDNFVGREKFHGGLAPDWKPKFEPAKPAPRFRAIALSRVTFKGVPPDPAKGHGTFFLDHVTLSRRESKGELALVKDGRAVATIVVPRISSQRAKFIIQQDPDHPVPYPKDADAWTTQAALWLQGYIRKATGVELKIASEDELPAGTIISVGHTRLAAKAGVDTRDLKYDGCKNVVKGNVLYLLGRDNKKPMGLVGPHGTCRAVLMFLEDQCGVRWFLPTPEGEIVPRTRNISAPRDLAKTFVPAFAYSDGRATYSPGFHAPVGGTPASIINNFRMGIPALAGGHTYYYAVPSGVGELGRRAPGAYFKDHPEYFALINGKRTGQGNHLCSSNPDVKKLLVRWIRERFDEGYEWVSLGQEDGFRACECPECEKLDDYRQETPMKHICERVFILHKAVIDELAKSHPDKKVILLCYGPTATPSKKIDYFGDNCILQLTKTDPKTIKAWRGRAAGMTGYLYWFNIQTPMGVDIHYTPREVAEKIRYLRENGFVGLSNCAEAGWGFNGPVFYTLGKMMGDPSLDYKALVEDYCRGVYGKAAYTMLEFLNLLYARHENVMPVPVEDFGDSYIDSALRANTRTSRWLTTGDRYLLLYPPDFLNRLERLLQKAEAEADTERARGWVRLTRDDFDFAKLLAHALISYRACQANPTKENWSDLKGRVQAFDAYRTKIINYPKQYADRWFPGYDYFCIFLTGNAENERIHYIPWEKRKPEVLKRGVKRMAVGYRGSRDACFIKEPLTLDFTKEGWKEK